MRVNATSKMAFDPYFDDNLVRRQSGRSGYISDAEQDAVRRHSDWSSLDFTTLCGIAKPGFTPRQPGVVRHVESPTSLHYAAHEGDVAAVRALLADGADANATSFFGMTPLHLVVREYARRQRGFLNADRWSECTRLLLEAGANPMLRCTPDCVPAGLGEGLVPPALRDAMVVLAERGVWRDDDRDHHERAFQAKQAARTYSRIGFRHSEDESACEEIRPGERAFDPRQRVSDAVLEAMTNVARRIEAHEVRTNERKPHRRGHTPRRARGSAAVALA